jgi:hypothetical protein
MSSERKLKPIVKHRETVGFQGLDEVQINLHIIKGENVPVRYEFIQDLNQNRGMQRRQASNFGGNNN